MELSGMRYSEKWIKIIVLLNAVNLISCAQTITHSDIPPSVNTVSNCHPSINPGAPQFIIGYGSLMQEKSKSEDSSHVDFNYPVYVSGYRRGWIEPGTDIGFSTTYLGVRPDAKAEMNAVYFQLKISKDIYSYDKREDTYCRVKVSSKQIKTLGTQKLPYGEYWIYLPRNPRDYLPSRQKPIVQSYVDIFLSGCFELEEKFHLKNFAKNCIKTTYYWSESWVNDRVYPRTAFDNNHYVAKIDPLLAQELPWYFKRIKIE